MLKAISSLASRSFSNSAEAMAAILEVMHRFLGARDCFVARTEHGIFEVVATDPDRAGLVEIGLCVPLDESY